MLAALFVGLGLATVVGVMASDHDDGEMDVKGRSLNLTDLFVFREDWQDSVGSPSNLIFIMNTNPRSLARQQYHFSSQARYEFHVSRIANANKSVRPEGRDDVILRFEFGAPDVQQRQQITLTTIKDGTTNRVGGGFTTSLADMNAGRMGIQSAEVEGNNFTVFAGLREDPFYFDVERYFRIRGLLATGVNTLGTGPIQGGANVFRSTETAVDFAAGYNVNSIVARVPIAFLQLAGEEVFDVWETISIPE